MLDSLYLSLSISLHAPSVPHKHVAACTHYVTVAWLALIGRSPSCYTRLLPIQMFDTDDPVQTVATLGGLWTSAHT